jgi:hypothetical protein
MRPANDGICEFLENTILIAWIQLSDSINGGDINHPGRIQTTYNPSLVFSDESVDDSLDEYSVDV